MILEVLTVLPGISKCVGYPYPTPPSLSISRRHPPNDRSHELCNNRVEHGGVNVVAVNDPFIEPKYAVSSYCHSIRSQKT